MIYFTADTHWGHANVIRYCQRPYSDVADMERQLIAKWNAVVRSTDTVYHLGDFGFQKPAALIDIMYKLNGKILLVPGNHDSKQFRNAVLGQDMNKMDVVSEYMELNENGRKIVLCHFPIESWNNMSHGSIHIHGHSHGNSRPTMNRFDAGVDACQYEPKPLSYFLDRAGDMNTRPDRIQREPS